MPWHVVAHRGTGLWPVVATQRLMIVVKLQVDLLRTGPPARVAVKSFTQYIVC